MLDNLSKQEKADFYCYLLNTGINDYFDTCVKRDDGSYNYYNITDDYDFVWSVDELVKNFEEHFIDLPNFQESIEIDYKYHYIEYKKKMDEKSSFLIQQEQEKGESMEEIKESEIEQELDEDELDELDEDDFDMEDFLRDYAIGYTYREYIDHCAENGVEALTLEELENDYEIMECYECGLLTYKDKTTRTSRGDMVCESCLDEYYSHCEHCGEYVPNEDISEVHTNNRYPEYWCEDCVENDAFWCNGNEEYYDCYYFTSYEVDGETYCSDYCENNFYYDEEDDCYYSEEPRQAIRSYHDSPSTHFYGKLDKRFKKRYNHNGLELEIDRKSRASRDTERELVNDLNDLVDSDNNELYYERDGSLDYGFEIITQPHTWKALKNMKWKEILQKIQEYGYISHDAGTCGLHMHISRDLFGRTVKDQERAIAKLTTFYDIFYNDIVRVSRRDMDTAERWASKYELNEYQGKEMVKKATDLAKGKEYANRYHAVNLTNYNTIEIRIMRGTLNYNTFMACLDFIYKTAIRSKYIKWSEIGNSAKWLKGIEKNTMEYIKKRGAFEDAIEYLEGGRE